jgi:hypothetical protein
MENDGDRDITGVTYGGQSMTEEVQDVVVIGGDNYSRCEIWSLNEAGIQAASGTTFVISYVGGSPSGETQAAITFQGVDQSSPITAGGTASNTTLSGATITTGAFNVAAGGMAVSGAVHGSAGSYNNTAWGGAWTEGSDQSPAAGMTMGTAHTTNAYGAGGTDTATATHTDSTNRQVLVAASLNPLPTVTSQVSQSSDDAEERLDTNVVNLTSSDLELINDGVDQKVGMRFQNITVPLDATITNAYIEFTNYPSATPESGATTLVFIADDTDNALTFTTAVNNITSRPETTASVTWNIAGGTDWGVIEDCHD